MRKILLNILMLGVSFSVAASPDYYIAGECNGWKPDLLEYKFSEEGDIYTITLPHLYGEFKITTPYWEHQYGAGSRSAGQILEPDKTYNCIESDNGYNMKLADQSASDVTITFDDRKKTVCMTLDRSVTLYLTGDFNNWQLDHRYKFVRTGEIYTLYTSNFKGNFKIVSGDGEFTFGRNVNPELRQGIEYSLSDPGSEMYFGGLADGSQRLKITLNPSGIPSGIIENSLSDSDNGYMPEYFNLQGVRVVNPGTGVFIRRCGPKTEKIIIR